MATKTKQTPEEERLSEIREAFQMFDRNKDGKVTKSEVKKVFQVLGRNPTDAEVAEMVDDIDSNGSNAIEFHEFKAMMDRQCDREPPQEEMVKAFKMFDKNGDGYISAKELRITMTKLGEKMTDSDVDAMLALADINNDGMINLMEFSHVMCL